MKVCQRCTMHLPHEAQVCVGCGLPFAIEAAAPEPVAAPTGPVTYEPVPDNPWRQDQDVAQAAVPAPMMAAVPVPIEEPVQAEASERVPAPVTAPVHAYTPPPLGTPIALTFADPLPPLPEPTAPVEHVGLTVASAEPTIPIAPPEANDSAAKVAIADDDLGVPAAFAPFVEEPVSTGTAEAPADVVPLIPATGLTIAPPAAHVPGWSDTQAEAVSG